MNYKIGVVVGLVAVLVLGVLFPRPVSVVEKVLGAFPGPEILLPFLSFNKVTSHYYGASFQQATSTICSYRTPNATTSLVAMTVSLKTGTSTALRMEMGTSTVSDATTTRIAMFDIPTGTNFSAYATTSSQVGSVNVGATLVSGAPIPPLTYLNVKVGSDGTGTGTGINLTGSCNYEVQEL